MNTEPHRAASSRAVSPRVRASASMMVIPILVGMTTYTLSPSVVLLRDEYSVSSATAALVVVGVAIGGLIASLAMPVLVSWLGRRRTLLVALGLSTVGVALLVWGQAIAVALCGAVFTSAAGNLLMNTLSVALAALDGRQSGRWLSRAHALLSGAGLIAPVLLTAVILLGWGWRAAFGVVWLLAAVALVVVLRLPALPQLDERQPLRARGGAAAGRFPAAAFWSALAALVLVTAAEHSTLYWAGDLLSRRHGLDPAVAALGVTAMLTGLVISRVVVGQLPAPVGERVVPGGLVLAVLGWAGLWFSDVAALGLLSLVVFGLGAGPAFPLLVARLSTTPGIAPERSMVAAGVGVGIAVGVAPFALAATTDRVGVHAGFVMVPLLLVVGTVVLAFGAARSRKERQSQ